MADTNMNPATRDQLLSRLYDGELPREEAETLRAQLTDEEQLKLHALAEVDTLLANTLNAEADAAGIDLWAGIEAALPEPREQHGKLLPFLRRRTVQVTAILSTLAAAAGLVLMLRPAAPSNRCDIEELDVAGQNATVISVPDERGQETALIWFDHQETDEWESL